MSLLSYVVCPSFKRIQKEAQGTHTASKLTENQ
jgi:hypothetical protein